MFYKSGRIKDISYNSEYWYTTSYYGYIVSDDYATCKS